GHLSGRDLVAKLTDGLGRRPDPGDPGPGHRLGELRAFGKEPIARVNGVGTGPRRYLEQLRDIEIRLSRRHPAEGIRLAREADVRGVAVGISVDRDALQARVAARTGHPDGDLAAVRDQHLAHPWSPPFTLR